MYCKPRTLLSFIGKEKSQLANPVCPNLLVILQPPGSFRTGTHLSSLRVADPCLSVWHSPALNLKTASPLCEVQAPPPSCRALSHVTLTLSCEDLCPEWHWPYSWYTVLTSWNHRPLGLLLGSHTHLSVSHQQPTGTYFCPDLNTFSCQMPLDFLPQRSSMHALAGEQGLAAPLVFGQMVVLFWMYSSDWLWMFSYTFWVHSHKWGFPLTLWSGYTTNYTEEHSASLLSISANSCLILTELHLFRLDFKSPRIPIWVHSSNPLNPQPRILVGRTDAEDEAPILWPPDSWPEYWRRANPLEKALILERLKAEGEWWDGWMVSWNQWAWILASSRR